MLTMTDRIARLDAALSDGRLIRRRWTHATDGREYVCLLAALSPEAGEAENAGACPAGVMPAWLAALTPWIDDEGSLRAWPGTVRRYAALARRWHVLDDTAWARAEVRVRVAIVREAMRHTSDASVLAACGGVIDALEGRGDLAAARSAAARAARAARSAASWAAAEAAARAASWAAAEAAEAARAATAAAAADRITESVLDAIDVEITSAEVGR